MVEIVDDPYREQKLRIQAKAARPRARIPEHIDLRVLKYVPRVIHEIKGETSHNIMAHMALILRQEVFRADIRFPHFQRMERFKRMKKIMASTPYQPIFREVVNYGGPGVPA
jgi:hypothetical protein